MKRHILFINDLDKLVPKKDSSLLLALTLKNVQAEAYLLFESDFYYSNTSAPSFKVYKFDGQINPESFYLEDFKVTEPTTIELKNGDSFYMRIDPPFDTRYLRYLWMQKSFEKLGVRMINTPDSIILNNEKLLPAEMSKSIPNYLGTNTEQFIEFTQRHPSEAFVLKPVDLYQGIGVEKVLSSSDMSDAFDRKVQEYNGPVLAQPFIASVEQGEIRACYYKGKEIGSILKVPPKGDFLANIAQGATFKRTELNAAQRKACEDICKKLPDAPWLAFDVLDDFVSEVNITCPGLLVEVSNAMGKNLCLEMVEDLV